jgi:hypothetical protein
MAEAHYFHNYIEGGLSKLELKIRIDLKYTFFRKSPSGQSEEGFLMILNDL